MKEKQNRRKWNWERITGVILFITLLLSVAYSIVKIAVSPSGAASPNEYENVRSDYVLMLLQCILGLVVMMIPSLIERRWSIDIPNYMHILFFVFLFCAIYLGEIRNFYYLIPFWDTILHAFSGAMLGALGFNLVSILNESERVNITLSPIFVALFAFCFALAAGSLWEIYEYTADGLLSLNMQKFMLADGTVLAGHAALGDTMKDITVDAISALIMAAVGYFTLEKNKGKRQSSIIPFDNAIH